MKKYLSKIATASICMAMLLATTTAVNAEQGYWTSKKSKDFNGVSQVKTNYTGGAGDSITVKLHVKYGKGDSVGYKKVGATENQTVEHTCVGQPLRDRYGIVDVPDEAYHHPSFNS